MTFLTVFYPGRINFRRHELDLISYICPANVTKIYYELTTKKQEKIGLGEAYG